MGSQGDIFGAIPSYFFVLIHINYANIAPTLALWRYVSAKFDLGAIVWRLLFLLDKGVIEIAPLFPSPLA